MILELRHLDLVRSVVEEGGLTRAGKRLGLSQSALSHQLRDVEEQFGVSLFHRIGRRLTLAPAGERILRTAGLVIPEMERTERDLRQNSSRMFGTIQLAAECYTCYQWIPGIAARFLRKYPAVDLRIVTGATGKAIEAVLENKLDLAVVSQPTRDRRLKTTDLLDEELVVAMAAGHPLGDKEYLRPNDFSSETLFSYPAITSGSVYLRMARGAGVRPNEVSEVPSTEAILELVKARFGIALLPRWTLQPHLGNGEFRVLPITARGLRRRWYAVSRSGKTLADSLTAFLKALRDESAPALPRFG